MTLLPENGKGSVTLLNSNDNYVVIRVFRKNVSIYSIKLIYTKFNGNI